VLFRSRRANAVFSAWGGALVERAAMLDPVGPGWVLDRRGFEDGLHNAAREVSACRMIMRSASCRMLLLISGQIAGSKLR